MSMAFHEELHPCPFCGELVRMNILRDNKPRYYFVSCSCAARGPERGTAADAAEAWNSRDPALADKVLRETLEHKQKELHEANIEIARLLARPAERSLAIAEIASSFREGDPYAYERPDFLETLRQECRDCERGKCDCSEADLYLREIGRMAYEKDLEDAEYQHDQKTGNRLRRLAAQILRMTEQLNDSARELHWDLKDLFGDEPEAEDP